MLKAEHSPIRAIMFRIEMDVPSFVSVHFTRHKIGVEHYVMSLRDDGVNADKDQGRETIVRHVMIANAQALINMARKRLCKKSHKKTREAMHDIVGAMYDCDHVLWTHLDPDCKNGRWCREINGCCT